MWKIEQASSWTSYHLRVRSDVERKHCCCQCTQELWTHPQWNEVGYIVIQIPKELHQGDWIFPKPRAFFLWLPGLSWETNTRLAQTAPIKEHLLQKGRTRCQVHLEQEANRTLQHTTDRKLECVPCHIITQKYWQTWPDWSQPKMWCVSKHVSSVAKQVRTKHQQRQKMWHQEHALWQVRLSRRCFWTRYLGRNMQAIEHMTYTWWPNSWQPNRCCFSSTSGGNFQQITHSGFKEIQNFPTEKPTFHTLDIRLKDEKMTHFSGSKFISSGMELFIVRDFSAWGRFMKEICNSHSSEQMGYRVSNILPWC